jgi:colanic acid/amylovoran biosynthesis glycosyltransferase
MIALHIVRKNTQLKASFIQNQIINHIDFEPHVIYYDDRAGDIDGGFASPLPQKIPVRGISSNNLLVDSFLYKIFKKLGSNPKNNLLKFIDEIKPDIIHLHYATDAGIYLPELKNLNIPKVVSVYGYESSGFPRRFLGYGKHFLKNRTYKFADRIFAMSPDMEKDLFNTGCPKEKIVVHYYGTDVQRFNDSHNYQGRELVQYLIISGLTPQKGHIFLLKAFKEAFQVNNKIKLNIVGDGPEKEKIADFIQSNNMGSYVTILPFVIYGSKEHKKYFADSDVFIHPSVTDVNGDKEGIPGAVVEAMAAGLPVISTFHAGIPYIIENGVSGLLVKEWDINGLKNAILNLANDSSIRKSLGQKGQKFALNNLDLYEKEKELEEIYKSLIKQ